MVGPALCGLGDEAGEATGIDDVWAQAPFANKKLTRMILIMSI